MSESGFSNFYLVINPYHRAADERPSLISLGVRPVHVSVSTPFAYRSASIAPTMSSRASAPYTAMDRSSSNVFT